MGTTISRTVASGLAAGAVGTVLLNAATYLDMALTGRRTSTAPGETLLRLAGSAGVRPPDDPPRRQAYGQLAGLGTGLGIGVAAATVRACGVRLPAPVGAAVTGAAAMAATDGPMVLTGVSDPGSWGASGWLRDAAPHLAYGAGVRWALDRTESAPARPAPARPAPVRPAPPVAVREHRSPRVVARSFGLGVAAGGRSAVGLAAPAVLAGGRATTLLGLTALTGELVADKLPGTPSRTTTVPAFGRLGAGAVGGAALARRDGTGVVVPALVGIAGAAVGTVAGATWREYAADRGLTWQAALAEDAVVLGLALRCWRGLGA